MVEKDKRLKRLGVLCLITLIVLLLVFVFHKDEESQGLSYADKIGRVLGVETSIEKQVRQIQTKKLEEVNKYVGDKPNPVQKIQMEGKLDSDPAKKQTIKSLEDLKKIYLFSYGYKITKNQRYLSKANEFILAWASTYKASGNSIDETHLEQLFEGYSWVRDGMSTTDIAIVDAWLKTIAEKEMKVKYKDDRDINNWNSHRINIIGQIGYITEDQRYLDYALDAYKKQIQYNLYADGSSMDFKTRDSVGYHAFNLWALLNFARTASSHGVDLYNYQSPSGASLKKSVHFLYPYINGTKTHTEFVNSKVAWDVTTGSKKKAAIWNPSGGLYIMELAYYFDDTALPLIQKLKNNKVEFPSFETYLSYSLRN